MTTISLYTIDDDYEYGIDKTNMSVQFVETSNGTICIKDDEMENPFFVGAFGGSLSSIPKRDIYTNYKKIYVMCMKDNFEQSDILYKIYDQIITKNDFCTIGKQFSLFTASLSMIMTNSDYFSRCCIVDKNCLVDFFPEQNNFDQTEIVLPMFELTESMAKLNITLYDDQFGIENISDILNLTSLYNKNYKKPIIDQFSKCMTNLKESKFWSDQRNCNINMTEIFMARGFIYKQIDNDTDNLGNDNIDSTVEKVISELSKENKKDTDYINPINTNNDFVDTSTALRNSSNRTYYVSIDNKFDMNKIDVENMVCSIADESELYYTFNSLLVSKEYCHMVVNSEKVLNKVKPLFDKYAPVYKLLFSYAWLCFTIEESIMKTKTTKENRYVFDINTANKLPKFPFVCEDVTQNPYITILVNKKILNAQNNALSLHCIENYNGYGVCTLEQFKWRFNLFTTGEPSINLFDGLDWNHFAVSGSLMPACLQNKSPLFDLVTKPEQSEKNKWLEFFKHYYQDSDIDMMCNDQSIHGFTEKTNHVIEIIKKNVPDYKNGDIEIEPVKSSTILLTEHFFTERVEHFNETYGNSYTSKEMKQNMTSTEMKEYLYTIYVENKTKSNSTIRKNQKELNTYMKSFMNISTISDMKLYETKKCFTKNQTNSTMDSEICLYVNDFRGQDNKVSEENNFLVMKIGENLKFKIRSKKFRTIELFRSKSADFFGVVARFHLPCVRGYYQDNVYLLPSLITAMMTGINIDYKYFAGTNDPCAILNKYRTRGFGILLSDQEKKHMAYYNNNVQTFGGLYHVGGTDKNEINKMFGPKELTDRIYRPNPDTQYNELQVNYLKTVNELKAWYNKTYGYDENLYGFNLFTIKAITEDGNIMPLKQWIAKEYYETKNSKQ